MWSSCLALWPGPVGTTYTALWLGCTSSHTPGAASMLWPPVTTCYLFSTLAPGLLLHPLPRGPVGCAIMTSVDLMEWSPFQSQVSELSPVGGR